MTGSKKPCIIAAGRTSTDFPLLPMPDPCRALKAPTSSSNFLFSTDCNETEARHKRLGAEESGKTQFGLTADERLHAKSVSRSEYQNSLRQASLSRATKQLMPTPRGRRPPRGEGLVYHTQPGVAGP